MKKDPYQVILSKHVSEKAYMLEQLHASESNAYTKACVDKKFVFIVSSNATKKEIKDAVMQLYPTVNVKKVNTLYIPRKQRRVRGHKGNTKIRKKAVITIDASGAIEV
jgi:ribosomal protein L23